MNGTVVVSWLWMGCFYCTRQAIIFFLVSPGVAYSEKLFDFYKCSFLDEAVHDIYNLDLSYNLYWQI